MRRENLGNAPRFRAIETRAEPGESGGGLSFIASTEDADRYGDTVLQRGWRLEAYRQNPVFLLAHDYGIPAIGRVGRVNVEDLFSGPALMARDVRFASTPLAQEIQGLYRERAMSGVSVGFLPLKMRVMTDEDAKRFGADRESDRRGLVFEEAELLEISAVSVPANPAALQVRGKRSFAPRELEETLLVARSIRRFDYNLARRMENAVSRVERYGLVCSTAPGSQACRRAEQSVFQRVAQLADQTAALVKAEPDSLAELFSEDADPDRWGLAALLEELEGSPEEDDPAEVAAQMASAITRNLASLREEERKTR